MLSTYDHLVIAFHLVFMAGVGHLCRRFMGNAGGDVRGGGKMLWWMAGATRASGTGSKIAIS